MKSGQTGRFWAIHQQINLSDRAVMRIGILSDTHNQYARTQAAVDRLIAAGAERLIHCGDVTIPSILELCAVRPLYFVLGNNDLFHADELRELQKSLPDIVCLDHGGEITLGSKRLAVTHGHLRTEYRQLMSAAPDYLFLGHSHIAADFREGATREINPGALHRASEYSVAVLDLDHDHLQFLTIPK